MTRWTITNSEKKQCFETTSWTKSSNPDRKIVLEVCWWSGTYSTDSAEKPVIEVKDNSWIASDAEDWELEEMTDGAYSEWDFPEDMEDEEQEAIEEAYDEYDEKGLEKLGWEPDDYNAELRGPFLLVNEDTGEEFDDFMPPQ